MSQTLAIIKPDAVGAGKAGKILALLEDRGFSVKSLKLTTLSQEQAGIFPAFPAPTASGLMIAKV